MTTVLLAPAVVLLLITFLVWLLMFIRRASETRAKKLDPQQLATPEQLSAAFSDRTMAAGNCFKNLTEMPMVFYVVCIFITLAGQVDALYLNLAWGFVALRAVQACVHCTYNRVMHRFIAYLAGAILVWAMVFRFALAVL